MTTRQVATSLLLLAFTAGCAPSTRRADALAGRGEWEMALPRYQAAVAQHPEDRELIERTRVAERQVALVLLTRAEEANAAGRLGDAGALWTRALKTGRSDADLRNRATQAIADNAATLEYYADVSATFGEWSEAARAYNALRVVYGDNPDLLARYQEAAREASAAAREQREASTLAADLRALQQDPNTPGAFERTALDRKRIQADSAVNVTLQIVHKGNMDSLDLSRALEPRLTARLDDHAPYTTRGEVGAPQALLLATIESFTKADAVITGVDSLPRRAPQSTKPVTNPEWSAQQTKIITLEKNFQRLRADLDLAKPPRGAKPAPATHRTLAPEVEAARLRGLNVARAVDQKRAELASAKSVLATIARTVPPPREPGTFDLAWTETTRRVEATIRFEVRETDIAPPIRMTLRYEAHRTDRRHAGNLAQGVAVDPNELPTFDQLNAELAERFAAEGPRLLAASRARRIDLGLLDRRFADDGTETIFLTGPDRAPEEVPVVSSR